MPDLARCCEVSREVKAEGTGAAAGDALAAAVTPHCTLPLPAQGPKVQQGPGLLWADLGNIQTLGQGVQEGEGS